MQMLLLAVVIAASVPASMTLTCYENGIEGKVHAVKNDVWKYCGLIPENESSEAQMFGIGSDEESLAAYDETFKQSDNFYKILGVCVYEKYELSKVSPSLGPAEFVLRCFCNYDRCNSQQTFQGYLNTVKRENEP